jgi:hypothetical protein
MYKNYILLDNVSIRIMNELETLKCPKDIKEFIKYVVKKCEHLSYELHDVEWYIDSDYGDESLRKCDSYKRWKQEKDKNND